MDLYRINLCLTSPTGSLWQSDTLFGQLCWQLVFRDGEDALKNFLKPFLNGDPPYVLSDGFPAGMLPRPLLSRLDDDIASTVEEYGELKERRKSKYLTIAQFHDVCSGRDYKGKPPGSGWKHTETLHASLDRNTNRTGGEGSAGELFQTDAWLPDLGEDAASARNTRNLQVYVRASENGLAILKELLGLLSKVGFGRDKSVGLGQFILLDIEKLDDWDNIPDADGFISLSSYVPATNDPTDGRWKIRVKKGALGEHLALSELPFKRPLIQFEPGAVFRSDGNLRPWCGRVVCDVSPVYPDIVQGCQSIALPLRYSVIAG
ncbi:MAG: hypothetical protein P9X24_06960 [Candidatus Hatepunaea meridiana]|nr:hypothetical protein [Candidatus Hatepunaea meridiana]